MKVFSRQTLFLGGYPGIILILQPIILLLFSRRRDINEYSTIDASAAIFILYTFISFSVAIKYIYNKKLPILILTRTPIKWFLYFNILCFLSVLWSVDFKLSTFRAFESFSMLLLIIATISSLLYKMKSFNDVIQWTLLFTFINILCSFISYLQWAKGLGIFQASQMFAPIFFYLSFKSNSKIVFCSIFLFSILSMSTTAYIGMIVGLLGLLFIKPKYQSIILLVILLLILIFTIIGIEPILKNTIFYRHQEILDAESLSNVLEDSSGRNFIWEVAFKSALERPWGYGFFAGEPFVLYQHFSDAINAHNSILSALMGTGFLGAFLIAIYFISFIPLLLSKHLKEYRVVFIGCFIVAFFESMGNPGIGSRVLLTWIPVTYLLVLISSFYYVKNESFKKNLMG